MNPSESLGVDYINLVWVAFASNVDTSDALKISLWSCLISTTFSSGKSTIANGDRHLSVFTKAALFPIFDTVRSLFTIVFTRVWYIGTSVSSNMQHFLVAVDMTCAFSSSYLFFYPSNTLKYVITSSAFLSCVIPCVSSNAVTVACDRTYKISDASR